jgi:hypothetical protein
MLIFRMATSKTGGSIPGSANGEIQGGANSIGIRIFS